MPTVQAVNETKVLVTGANGFIASWIIRTLLEKGYSVRGTVRTAEKGKYLVETYAKYGDRFEIFVVDDMSKVGIALSSNWLNGELCSSLRKEPSTKL